MMIDPSTLNLDALEQQHGLSAGLLTAVMMAESNGNPNAVSPAGAQGLFQFMPATAAQYGIDPNDPVQAAQGAARMYGDLNKKYNGDVPSMLAAYNWGQGNLDKNGLQNAPAETQKYISKIQGMLQPQSQQVADSGQIMNDASGDAPGLPAGFVLDKTDSQGGLPPGFVLDSQPQEKGIFSRIGEDLSKRLQTGQETAQAYNTGQQGIGQTAVQFGLGTGVGSGFDILGEGIKSAYGELPQSIRSPLADYAKTAANYVSDSPVGDALRTVGKTYGDWADAHPNAARTASSLGNLAAFLPVGKATGVVGDTAGSAISKVGQAVVDSAENRVANSKQAYVQDLVLPKETPTVAAENAKRSTSQGILQKSVYNPTPEEQAIAATVSTLPVSKSNTIQKNLSVIQAANKDEAKSLIDRIQKNDVPVDLNDIQLSIGNTVAKLKQNPYVTGNGETAALKIVDFMNNAILNNADQNGIIKASNLLKARKEFDSAIKAQKGGKIFDPNLDSATSIAIQQMRQSINDLVANAVPTADVKASLAKQSMLYTAADNIAPKAAKEAATVVGRIKQRSLDKVNLKNTILAGSALVGAHSLGLPLAAGALATYGAGKVATSPALQKLAGSALRETGNLARLRRGP